MRRSNTMIVVLGLLSVGACNKGGEDKAQAPDLAAKSPEPAGSSTPAAADKPAVGEVSAEVGVAPGGIEREVTEGPAAVVTAASGTVEVRRVGEAEFAAAKVEAKLYSGDAVRTADGATATITLADESVIEVSEVTTVGIGSRNGTADPGSSAAVLSGLARFTVSARAPAEGPFRVYTAAGMIVTRGTTYGVGVAASGETRVGVESGTVDVIGLAAIDAEPVAIEGGTAISLAASGTLGAPAPWPKDDWGSWRDEVDAKLEAQAVIEAHATALANLNTQLVESYAALNASADTVATFEVGAAASADKDDTATYEASLPDGAATIDASFALAGRVELLTWAYAGRATLASDIYVRNPAAVETRWQIVAPRIDAAVLWPKRYEVTATAYIEPLRMQYYVHHPRGRVHAELVGIAVPEFYAKIEPPQLDPIRVRSRVKLKIWIAPELTYRASVRPVWIAAPSVDWRARVRVQPAPFRANVAWYVRPPTLRAKLVVGRPLAGKYTTRFKIGAPAPRASLVAAWKVPIGVKVRVRAPDLTIAAKARARIKLDGGGRLVVRDRVRARVDVRAPDVKVKVVAPDVRTKVNVRVPGVTVKAGAGVRADAGARVKVKVKTPAVKVKVKAPAVKVKIKAPSVKVKAGFKIGG